MASIVISNLNEDATLTTKDFFPIVSSGSLTSYRVDFETLKTFYGLPQVSCSWTTHSISSSYALSASYPPFPQISSSWTSRSFSSSYSVTASWAPHSPQIFYDSMSFASRSLSSSYSITASFAPSSQQFFQPTCSWTSRSFSSSYTLSASWAPQTLVASGLFTYIPFQRITMTRPITQIAPAGFRFGVILSLTTPYKALADALYIFTYITSSVMPVTVVSGLGHGNVTNTFYVSVGVDGKFYLSGSNLVSASIIGYY